MRRPRQRAQGKGHVYRMPMAKEPGSGRAGFKSRLGTEPQMMLLPQQGKLVPGAPAFWKAALPLSCSLPVATVVHCIVAHTLSWLLRSQSALPLSLEGGASTPPSSVSLGSLPFSSPS